jgi:hypothetical protein
MVTIISAMGEEAAISYKEAPRCMYYQNHEIIT